MSIVLDDIQLIAPAPNPVTGGQAQCTGATGIRRLYYWVVTHYPIGASVAGPFAVINAPDQLTGMDAVQIVWDAAIGATEYDVIRTDTGAFPQAPGDYMVAPHLPPTVTFWIDTTEALAPFNPTGLPFGAPAMRHIYLNNRDYSEPTIELDAPLKTSQVIFSDGSSMSGVTIIQDEGTPLPQRNVINFIGAGVTATDDPINQRTVIVIPGGGAGGAQTPWLQDVDAVGFSLNNAGRIGVGVPAPAAPYKFQVRGGRSIFESNGDQYAIYLKYNATTEGMFLGGDASNSLLISDSPGNVRVTVTQSGNMSIGDQANLQSRLSIFGPATNPSLTVPNGLAMFRASTTLSIELGALTGDPFSGWIQTTNKIGGAGTVFPLAINPLGGNVGISNNGSPAPYPDANVRHLIVGNTIDTNYGAVTVCTNRPATSSTIGVFGFANYAIAADQKMIASMAAATTTETNSGNLALFTAKAGNLLERMRINEEGWVGIGNSFFSPPPYLDPSADGVVHLMVGNATTGPTTYGAITVCAHRAPVGPVAVGTVNFANMAIGAAQPEKRIAALIARTGSTEDSGELLICTRNSAGVGARILLTEDGLIQLPNVNTTVPAGLGFVYKDASGFLKITG